ncbi:phosphatidylinositol 4-kinase alpha-like isoform X2 [Symsagittifera roscoffensis]|uniref:phosphatidylinositol 4-kinase alpha-like isoform X2 n=1 Tax=Symsagittifera roscoffensis TaxID=84072 RepID=UPI00307B4458
MEISRTFYEFLVEEENFKLCFKLANSVSCMKEIPLANLRLLFEMSPIIDDGTCILDSRSLSGLIALNLTMVESGFKHYDTISNYLLELLSNVRNATWDSPYGVSSRRSIIFPEFFGVVLGTILTDIAAYRDDMKSEIVERVFEEFDYAFTRCADVQSIAKPEFKKFVGSYVPFIIGLLRTFARKSSMNIPVTSLLFNESTLYKKEDKGKGAVQKNPTITRRSTVIPAGEKRSITGYENRFTLVMKSKDTQNAIRSSKIDAEKNKSGYELIDFDPVNLFHHYGSSYPILKLKKYSLNQLLNLTKTELIFCRNVISNLLNDQFLQKLDDGCEYLYYKLDKKFPYKSYSEIISLSAISMVKALVYNSELLANDEVKTAFHDIVKVQYVLLNNIDIETKYLNARLSFSPDTYNPYYLFSRASAETTELLVKLTEEESAEVILTKLQSRISKTGPNFARSFVFELPMYECALNCMGTQAEKFPSSQVAKSVVDHLKNFLLDPSLVLSSVYGLSHNITLTATLDKEIASRKFSLANPLSAFARLRDVAIANLCRALQAVNLSNQTEIDAALATISAKSYLTAESRTRDVSGRGMMIENEIVSRNCILILGHLALTQRQSFAANADLMSKVLSIFQQMFSRDSAYMDDLIIDQMGYMVMVGPAGGPLWALPPSGAAYCSETVGSGGFGGHSSATAAATQSLWWDNEEEGEYESVVVEPSNNQVYQQIMKLFSHALCGSSAAGVLAESKVNSPAGGPQFTFAVRSSSLGASLEASAAAISHVIPSVIRTMTAMSASIRDHEHMTDFLLRLLNIFNSLGMSNIRPAVEQQGTKTEGGGPKVQNKCNSGELLAPIATLLDRIPQEFESQKQVYKAFQQFWFFVSRLQLDDESKSANVSPKWFEAITRIARKAPLLVSSEESQNLKQIVDVDFKFMDDYSANEMQTLKTQLISRTKAKEEFYHSILKIETSSQINFAIAAITLESLRHKHASIPSFRVIFQYFEELQLMKEGKINNMWTVTKGICDYVFTIYLDTMRCQSRNMAHENLLKEHSQYLLIKFNDPAHAIRKQADHYLSQLLTEFPNILWNYNFIKTSLDILELQSMHIQQRQEGIALKTPVSETGLELVHTRTTEERQATLNDFTERTRSFILAAVQSAGNTTKSHLMHYIDTKDEQICSTSSHPGWGLAMDFLVNNPQNDFSFGNTQEQGNIVSFMTRRSKCLGEARGMILSLRELGKSPKELHQKYARELMLKDNSDEVFLNAVFRLSALIIMSEENSETSFMLKTVCCGFLNHFTEQGVNNSIACWEWILSARNDLTLQLFMYICEAWHSSKDRKLGIFSDEKDTQTSSIFTQGSEMPSNLEFVVPHNLLIQFMEQKFATFKFSDHDVVDMLYHLVGQTLHCDSLVKDPNLRLDFKPIMNRSLGAVGVRFRILLLALHLLQFKFPKEDNADKELHSRNVYQKRILNCAFEYFTQSAFPPVQSRDNLREDISALIDFFVLLRSERMRIGRLLEMDKKARAGKKDELKLLSSKLNLLNLLVWTEIERLTIWFNPIKLPFDDPKFKQWPKLMTFVSSSMAQINSDKFWSEYTFVAWCICPDLAVHLPSRFKYHQSIIRELKKLVRNYPQMVSHIPQAVDYLCCDMEDADSAEVMPVLTWKYGTPCAALKLLFTTRSSYTAQYAIRLLQSYPEDVLIFFVPQIVQSLRYDDVLGYVKEFILWAAKKYEILAHQLIWNMETNAYRDEDKNLKDEKIGDLCLHLVEQIKKNFTPEQEQMYRKEFAFFHEVTSISGKIRPFEKGPKRKAECQRLLKNIEVGGERKGCYLPTDPNAEVVGIDYSSGIPMQSAAKAPFLAKFFVQKKNKKRKGSDKDKGDAKSVSVTTTATSQTDHKKEAKTYVQGCIFKVGDDCRQDMLCLQLIQLFQNIFQSIGLDLYLFPYKVVATAPGCGVIECVPDSRTRDELGKTAEQSLNLYFINMFGEQSSREYQEARRNFVISMAAYSVVGYIMQIKDRHNGNIMIDKFGHVIHIDFGFLFESSPGNNLNWEPDFKLTAEFVDLMCAGYTPKTVITEPPFYRLFRELTVKGFLALRPYHEEIITIVTLMLETGLPCFRGQTIPKLKDRLKLNLSEREARDHMLKVINENSKNFWGKTYDMIQALQNDIAYF